MAMYIASNYYVQIVTGQYRGVPNQLAMQNNRAARIDSHLVPGVSDAITLYQASGGRLGAECTFGIDPLATSLNFFNSVKQQWN